MNTKPNLSGIHHITAIASSAAENLAFYEKVLGMRLVKKTINFDDPYTYHLYYGDAEGSPGTILTFFPWENLPKARPGSGMVTAVGFAIPRHSIDYWTDRIAAFGLNVKTGERFGDPVLQFTDPHGLPIELIGISNLPITAYWDQSPVAKEYAIIGFHSATATLNELDAPKILLTDVMGMTLHDRQNNRFRFKTKEERAAGRFYDVVIDPQAPVGRPGGGSVHHIAFRTDNDASQSRWQSILRASGLDVTGVRDRKYFHSIYFHSPGGVLFEIATDPPGFTADEPLAKLGTALKLPEAYAHLRSDIENQLPPLRSNSFRYVFEAVQGAEDDGGTWVTLHGTGGNERDLMDVARAASSTRAILSPRGKVVENGMVRFFKRIAENQFDEKDLIYRTHELSDFIMETTPRHGRDPKHLTALGYSNGANIAAATLLLRPEVFSSAVLLRPMLPLQPDKIPDLHDKKVLLLKGAHDTTIPSASADHLSTLLQQAGADVTFLTLDAGHAVSAHDLKAISHWLSKAQGHQNNGFHDSILEAISP